MSRHRPYAEAEAEPETVRCECECAGGHKFRMNVMSTRVLAFDANVKARLMVCLHCPRKIIRFRVAALD